MMWWRKKNPNPLIAAYEATTEKTIAPKTPLADIKFITLDSETTGFDTAKDRMLSLALVELKGGRLHMAKSASWYLFQEKTALNSAVSVHGIMPAQTARGQPEAEVMLELLPRLTGAVIVGHHVGFDAAMIHAALQRHLRISLRNPLLDTASLAMESLDAFAKTAYPGQRAPTLDEVCAQCDQPLIDRHTAEGDAFTTAMVFLSLCAKLQRRLDRPLRADDLPLVRA